MKDEGASLSGHVEIARLDHWIKNLLVLPGILLGFSVFPERASWEIVPSILLGFFSIGLVASSNYVLNEILDAPFDRDHPTRSSRPVPSGRVHRGLAWLEWLLFFVAGVGLGWLVSPAFALCMLALWLAGCLYNVPPIRAKDIPYVDVLTEALNNPLRMLAGWLMVGLAATRFPVSLLLSYWMLGAYFMAIKRFAELRQLGDPARAARYRRSFATYSESSLLVSTVCYAAASMLFLGAFVVRYRLELILSFPLVALVMAIYLARGFQPGSVVQTPEKLYREPSIVIAVALCAITMAALLYVDLPILHRAFRPTLPVPVR